MYPYACIRNTIWIQQALVDVTLLCVGLSTFDMLFKMPILKVCYQQQIAKNIMFPKKDEMV